MSRRLSVSPRTLLAALPLTSLACAGPPLPAVESAMTAPASEAAAATLLVAAPPETAETVAPPELSCRLGNTKAPNYDTPDDC